MEMNIMEILQPSWSNTYQVSVVKSRTDAICRGGVVPTVKAINRHARLLVLT